MNRLNRREFLKVAAGVVGAGALTACAVPVAPQPAAGEAAPQKTAGPYVVKVWSCWDLEAEMKAESEVFPMFGETNPGLSIDHSVIADFDTKFRTAAAAKDLPDVFSTDGINITAYACRGLLADLTDIIPASTREDYWPPIKEEILYANKQWGVPVECHAQGVYYNKDWLAEAGMTFPTTWDELKAVCAKVVDVEGGKFGYTYPIGGGAYAVWWEALTIWQAGGRMTDETETKATINTPECVEAITYLQELYQSNYLPHEGQITPGPEGSFRGKLTCMETTGSWGMQAFVKEPPAFQWGWGAVPYGPVNVQGVSGGWHWTMWNETQHKEEAAKVMQWLAGDEWGKIAAERFRIISPRKSIAAQFPELSEEPWKTCLAMINDYGKVTRPKNKEYPLLADAAGEAFENAVIGGMPVQEQLDKAQAKMTKIIDGSAPCIVS